MSYNNNANEIDILPLAKPQYSHLEHLLLKSITCFAYFDNCRASFLGFRNDFRNLERYLNGRRTLKIYNR